VASSTWVNTESGDRCFLGSLRDGLSIATTANFAGPLQRIEVHDSQRRDVDPHKRIDAQLRNSSAVAYPALRKEHIDDYQKLFCRFELDLGSNDPKLAALPTDRRNENSKRTARDWPFGVRGVASPFEKRASTVPIWG
jgi:hypothetical protein